MRILVIGGSSFVGRHFVQAALDAGHDLTLFNRGRTDPGAFPDAEHITGDRNGDLSELLDRSWDATVDVCAYWPAQVRRLLETLSDAAGHYTFISTISVYPDDTPARFTEDLPLRQPAWDDELRMDKYGELKVGCEQVAKELAGDRLLVVRPGYVLGPHDPTHRFTYWVERVADGRSPMAVAETAQPLQGVDARDLAAFVTAQVGAQAVDVFNVTAPDPAPTFGQVLEAIARGVGATLPDLREVGFHQGLPLTAPRTHWALMQADLSKAVAAGLQWRPLEETAADTLEWVREARGAGSYDPRPGVGLTPEEETALLDG